MLLETLKLPNGDAFYQYDIYKCDKCGGKVEESHPHMIENDGHYCWDCSFINGLIDEKTYLKCCPIKLNNVHASVRDGEVVVWVGKIAPWEKSNKESRNTPAYKKWRTSVFERDKYTCQHCGQTGGELNAHHIKPFAKYKSLRYEINNGLTLCVSCHREEHKKTG